jgi:hypothetical protein
MTPAAPLAYPDVVARSGSEGSPMDHNEAIISLFAEVNILRPLVIILLAREAARSEDPVSFLRGISDEMTRHFAAMPDRAAGTVQEGFDRLMAEALSRSLPGIQ